MMPNPPTFPAAGHAACPGHLRLAIRLAVAFVSLAVGGCLEQVPADAGAYACSKPGECADVAVDSAGVDVPPADAADDVAEPDASDSAADADAGADDGADGVDAQGDVADSTADVADIASDAADAGPDVADPGPDVADAGPDGPDASTDGADAAPDVPVCPATCDDGSPCTSDDCQAGACVHLPLTGTACDDADPCTNADLCTAGTCKGKPVVCPGNGPCLVGGSCDKTTGACSLAPAATGTACDDANICTTGDHCLGGVCLPGSATSCDDGNPCTDDSCANPSGCVSVPTLAVGTPCTDGNACTTGDGCKADGTCGGKGLVCNDGSPCTADSCNPLSSCVFLPQAGTCTDGNPCTAGDSCGEGVCLAGTASVDCDDKNGCTTDSCDATAGCTHVYTTAPCQDGNPCTTGDVCSSGSCKPGTYTCQCKFDSDCDDKTVCTSDACKVQPDTTFACVHLPVAVTCDDGSACTSGDTCSGGLCQSGATVSCDDGSPCTNDSCDAAKGCQHIAKVQTALPCDGTMSGGWCYKASNSGSGTWANAEATCQAWGGGGHLASIASQGENDLARSVLDGVCAGQHAWLGASEAQAGAAWTWTDGSAFSFTAWGTNQPSGTGTYLRIYGNGKWADSSLGDKFTCFLCKRPAPTACDDGSACTANDSCFGGACSPGLPVWCDDGNVCTADACDPTTGCTHTHVANNTTCVADNCGSDGLTWSPKSVCSNGTCTAGAAPKSCVDGNACTDDKCSPSSGCSNPNNTANCDDKNSCTVSDKCAGGTCAGSAKDCDDKNVCTTDACASGTCSHTAVAFTGTACTGTTWGGHCYEAVKNAVDWPTSEAACVAKGGHLASVHSPDENEIVRGVLGVCSGTSAWVGGTSINATARTLVWSDGSAPTWYNWAPTAEPNGDANGRVEFLQTGGWNDATSTAKPGCYVCERLVAATCDDGSACTTGDVCSSGKCGGLPVTCGDKCYASQLCSATSGCGSLVNATHNQQAPAFCDASDSFICTAGACSKSPSCGVKKCGFDGSSTDCGKCTYGNACKADNTCGAYPPLAGTALFPGGSFAMGCVLEDTNCDGDELPRVAVYVSPFYLDNSETSVGGWKSCIAAGKCTAPANGSYPSGGDTMPVLFTTWQQARGYCQWRGSQLGTAGDLPTQAQWEFAARFNAKSNVMTQTIYPWGNAWPPPGTKAPTNWGVASLNDGVSGVGYANTVFDEITGAGIINLLGNVREWTLDEDATHYEKFTGKDPIANDYGFGGRVVKGGSFKSDYGKNFAGRLSYRDWIYDNGKEPDGTVATDVGFRCAFKFTY